MSREGNAPKRLIMINEGEKGAFSTRIRKISQAHVDKLVVYFGMWEARTSLPHGAMQN